MSNQFNELTDRDIKIRIMQALERIAFVLVEKSVYVTINDNQKGE